MFKQNNKLLKYSIACAAFPLLLACQAPSGIDDATKNLDLPEKYWFYESSAIKDAEQNSLLTLSRWLTELDNQTVNSLIGQGIAQNRQLQILRLELAKAEQAVTQSNASDWPELSLDISQSRRKTVSDNDVKTTTNNASIDLNLSYELDLWGKLSAEQQRSQLAFNVANANYQQGLSELVSNIASKWYSLAEAEQLSALYKQRAKNLQSNLEQIKASYRLGLNQALDVYLTQNDVSSELARVEQQKQLVIEASRDLEVLLGDYPKAQLKSDAKLPSVNLPAYAGLPAELVTRRYDLNASWYQLMRADASLAIAHKNRFPSFKITATTGDSSDELGNLLDGGTLGWSILGNISQPLFNAGRLEAIQEQAFIDVKIQEQRYIDDVYQAFVEIENGVNRHQSLKSRFDYFKSANENAVAAESLSFSQYLNGIVSYTTVLESQRRAFDAQTQLIQLKSQLLQNQIQLALSLGGNNETFIDQFEPSSLADQETE